MSQFASKDDLLAAQAARIAELESQLEAIGAGGVEPLRKQAAAQQAVPASVIAGAVFDFAGYLTTLPHKEAIHCSEAHEAAPMVEAITEWCKRRNLTTDGAKVETWRDHLAEAPAHPAEGVPAQIETLRSELAEEKEAADNWRRLALQFDIHRLQALWHLKRILHADSSVDEYKAAEQFLAAPPLDGEAVLAQRIAALAATQPAAQGMDAQDAKRYRWLRECNSGSLVVVEITGTGDEDWHVLTEADADAAIDAALAAQAKQGGAA